MDCKQKLGQFYTTNQDYILQDMYIPENISNIIEPFAGQGDLIKFIEKMTQQRSVSIECYDLDPKKEYIKKRDTIMNPPDYKDKFIITNPPYLARNKSTEKILFDKYNVNDLYKCVIKEILTNVCLGGILIIPLNFWSSIRKTDIELRKLFMEKYKVLLLNIFEEQVFEDTTYTVCSFQFEKRNKGEPLINPELIKIVIYPSKKKLEAELNDNNNYMIGGEIYNLSINNNYKVSRLTSKNKDKIHTNILVKCIDDNENNKIGLRYEPNRIFIDDTPNQSSRTYATLIIEPNIDERKQKKLIEEFNKYLTNHRETFNSLFLTNYRESKDLARKRISFDLVYQIVKYILEKIDN